LFQRINGNGKKQNVACPLPDTTVASLFCVFSTVAALGGTGGSAGCLIFLGMLLFPGRGGRGSMAFIGCFSATIGCLTAVVGSASCLRSLTGDALALRSAFTGGGGRFLSLGGGTTFLAETGDGTESDA